MHVLEHERILTFSRYEIHRYLEVYTWSFDRYVLQVQKVTKKFFFQMIQFEANFIIKLLGWM